MVERRLEKLHKFGCSEYYRLILTDINMPEMDGIQMTRRIRALYQENQADKSGLNIDSMQKGNSILSSSILTKLGGAAERLMN